MAGDRDGDHGPGNGPGDASPMPSPSRRRSAAGMTKGKHRMEIYPPASPWEPGQVMHAKGHGQAKISKSKRG